jgi:stage V sporulation protein S
MESIKVSAKSNPTAVAGAIAGATKKEGRTVLQVTLGVGALNRAVKAIAIARGFLAPLGYDLIMVPAFVDIEINSGKRTALKLFIQPRGCLKI